MVVRRGDHEILPLFLVLLRALRGRGCLTIEVLLFISRRVRGFEG